ncbi:histidine phosphatase family protein [Propioniciclava coleopterorum]|uniref:Histidine phosphatase family protein n=1 Tax=Propioniciclava coleopterorum TaxID=2714937 RepID=A0A6G7Y3U2_9ACTN|nr:histidine phosphatase family protein [Propioniciclava coleopterorum]QIK71318.1 histidine phosphatase family protein [Propioniciclava coleopterorum]
MTTTRTLVVMRHGKSSWKTNDPDIARPLNPRGTRDAVVAGQILAPLGFDLALVSPAARAQQTWQCLQMGGATAREVRTLDALYHAWTPQIIAELKGLPAGAARVLMIGHEPTLSDVILTLTPPSASRSEIEAKFPTSAIAVLTTEHPWDALAEDVATLAAYEVPRG